jgi:hypothetical protein
VQVGHRVEQSEDAFGRRGSGIGGVVGAVEVGEGPEALAGEQQHDQQLADG